MNRLQMKGGEETNNRQGKGIEERRWGCQGGFFYCCCFNLAFASKRGKRGPRLEWRRGWTLLTDGSKYGFLLLLIKVQEQGGGTYRTDDLPQPPHTPVYCAVLLHFAKCSKHQGNHNKRHLDVHPKRHKVKNADMFIAFCSGQTRKKKENQLF